MNQKENGIYETHEQGACAEDGDGTIAGLGLCAGMHSAQAVGQITDSRVDKVTSYRVRVGYSYEGQVEVKYTVFNSSSVSAQFVTSSEAFIVEPSPTVHYKYANKATQPFWKYNLGLDGHTDYLRYKGNCPYPEKEIYAVGKVKQLQMDIRELDSKIEEAHL